MGKSRRQNNRNRRKSRRLAGGAEAVEPKPSRTDKISRRLGLNSSGTLVRTINDGDNEWKAGFQQLTSGPVKEATFKIGKSQELAFDQTGSSIGRSKILKHARKIKLNYEPLDSGDKKDIMYSVRFTDTQGTTASKPGNGEFKVKKEDLKSPFQEDDEIKATLDLKKVVYIKSANENNLHVAFLGYKTGARIKDIKKFYNVRLAKLRDATNKKISADDLPLAVSVALAKAATDGSNMTIEGDADQNQQLPATESPITDPLTQANLATSNSAAAISGGGSRKRRHNKNKRRRQSRRRQSRRRNRRRR